MRKAPVVAALRAQRVATLRRLAQLEEAHWEARCRQSLTVRQIAARLVAVDEAWATGRILRAVRAASDGDDFAAWGDSSAARWLAASPTELLEALVRWGDRVVRLVARTPSVVGQLPVQTWMGRHPLLYYTYRRLVDEWVHECDVVWATGPEPGVAVPDPEPGVADALATAVLHALPGTVLPHTDRTSGVLRLVVETEEGSRRTWGVDFARRQYGPRVTAAPDAVVRTDAATLTLLAEGRWARPSVPAGRLIVEGDQDVAHHLLDAVAPIP